MATGSEAQPTSAEALSALVDGELDVAGVGGACAHWRSDGASRATWHAYQLIGDVLRSEGLASDAAHDAAFLSALRGRLAAEPVVLAPQPMVAAVAAGMSAQKDSARRRRWSWAAPSAVAAGFVAVAGVLVVTRSPAPTPSPTMAGSSAIVDPAQVQAVAVARPATAGAPVAVEPSRVATGQLIRDAGLDQYLAAHKHFAGSAALGVPSAFLRSATMDTSGR